MAEPYKSAADCPLGEAHGACSTHGGDNGERLCDWCGFPADTVVSEPPWPVERVRELGKLVIAERTLHQQQAATQAQLIRGCIAAIRMDVNTYKMRGHEGWLEKRKQIAENKRDRAAAFLYLEWLATQLENQTPDNLALSTEGASPCSQA